MSQSQPMEPQLSGNMFLFERPELLTKETHGGKGVTRPATPFGFCSKIRAVPLTISEIPSAMKDYPVVFMSQEDPIPLAVLGLVDDVNLFVDEKGDWEQNRYIPGYIRRYPFALASETGGDRMAIVIDGAHEGVKEGGEIPFFDANGESSEATKQAIEFCKQYEQDRQMTVQFMEQLKPLDLIKGQTAQYTPQGSTEQKVFAQYFGVDEKALQDMSDEKFLELRKSGLLAVIYAQLMSLSNWRLLMQRRLVRYNLSEESVLEPVTLS
ncbi:MAG: SapC family protein [Pseudomonadota bacterium]